MDKNVSSLHGDIVEFIAVILDCLHSTPYANDRNVYLHDVAIAASWLVSLKRGEPHGKVIEAIMSPQTDKRFSDYWRQGEPGEIEIDALKTLQQKLKEYEEGPGEL